MPGPGTCPSSTETTSCQKKHRFSKNEKTTLKFHLDSWPRDTTSSRFSMRPSCECAQWKSSPPLTSISPTFLPWFVLLLPCRLGITQTGNKNPKEWEIWEEWPPCLHSLCSRINETVPVHGHKPSRNRFTESHWICTDCTVLHRHIHSRCSITVLQNRPKDPKAAHSPWSWICEPNHLQTRRCPKWPSQKPQRARCATPLRRDTRLRDLRRVSSLWQGLGEKQRPWRFERVPQPLKNGRVPIKKKLQYKARPFFKICGYQTCQTSPLQNFKVLQNKLEFVPACQAFHHGQAEFVLLFFDFCNPHVHLQGAFPGCGATEKRGKYSTTYCTQSGPLESCTNEQSEWGAWKVHVHSKFITPNASNQTLPTQKHTLRAQLALKCFQGSNNIK